MSKFRNATVNFSLVCASVVVFLTFCEFVVFRFVLLPAEMPRNAFIDGLVRYAPNQRGIYRVQDEIAAPFAINAQGWNSGFGDYRIEREITHERIAVIGDSYVEALQVPYNRSLAERLQACLLEAGQEVEVYRFGISGAPLSHYLYMLEHAILRYAPDQIVIVLVHNDFNESFGFKAGRYTSSFMKLALEGVQVVGEIPPTPYEETWRDWLRQLATVRYFYYRKKIKPAALRRLIFQLGQRITNGFEANIEVADVLARLPEVNAVIDYLFNRLAALSREYNFQLPLVMDAERESIYTGTEGNREGASVLNALVETHASRNDLRFLDLTKAFARDWRKHGKRFEFSSDNHWNERAHGIVAEAIMRVLQPRFLDHRC